MTEVAEATAATASRYDVFLSYSHADLALAERVSRRVRTYRPPRAAKVRRRGKLEVFRDRERFTASPDLSRLLVDTVGSAEHLVLLASPSSAASAYVNREVETFLERKDLSGISIVACGGELPDNLPPALRARAEEPLYIDLRGAGRRTFRLETLRLIAALHGVDYSELRREDDLRRLRRRVMAVAATVALAIGLGSAYLVDTTPAEAWEQVAQPATSAGPDPLMPIERVAINARDPSVVIWLGDNARYKRDMANVKETWMPPAADLVSFEARAGAALGEAGTSESIQPVATVSLEASRGPAPMGSGELRIYRVEDKGGLRYGRTFRFRPRDESGKVVALPFTLVEADRSPFDLEPWPAEQLRRAGFDTGTMTVAGTMTDHTAGGSSEPVEFFVSDNRADVREVLDATAGPEHVALSSSEDDATRLQARLDDVGSEDLWAELAADPEWVVYRPPERAAPLTFARESSDLREDARSAHLEGGLVAALDPSLLKGDLVDVERVTRSSGSAKVSVATLAGIRDSHEAVAAPVPARYFRSGAADRWLPMNLPLETPSTRVVDVLTVESNPRAVLVVTDREGLFRSLDDGVTWQSVGFGEPRLRNGERVRVIVASSSVYALATLHDQPGDDPNPLFRLVHRDWIRRWRLGFARVLAGSRF